MVHIAERAVSAVAIADQVRRGELTSVESTEAALASLATQKVSTQNAFVTVAADYAMQQAKEVDRRLAEGQDLPLAGVPISVKDTISTAGVRTTCGSLLLRHWVPNQDATAVTRLKGAGAIILGKTNCPEFGNDIQTTNRVHGTTRNPLDDRLSAGGSSGGDAAAVSAGLVPIGIGTDFGGSVRWPAQCTGTLAIRPTAGLVPADGQWGPLGSDAAPANTWSLQGRLQVIGPIARTIEDLALATNVLTGAPPLGDVPLGATHVHWLEGEGHAPVHGELVAAVHMAVGSLTTTGLRVEPAPPSLLSGADQLFTRMRDMDDLDPLRRLAGGREDQLTPMIKGIFSRASSASVSDYLEAGRQREHLRLRVQAAMGQNGVLVLPVSTVPAFPVGADKFVVDGTEIEYWQALAPCRAISLVGLPALSVPILRMVDGRWASVQLVGQEGSEAQLFKIGKLLRQAAADTAVTT